MPIAVSTTDSEATLARLCGPPDPTPPLEPGSLPAPPPASSLQEARWSAMAAASLGLFLDAETRGVLTSDQHRAGREAGEAFREAEERDRAGWANRPHEVPR